VTGGIRLGVGLVVPSLTTASLTLRCGHRSVTEARATGPALAADDAAAVDLDDLDLIHRRKPQRQPFRHVLVHDHQGHIMGGSSHQILIVFTVLSYCLRTNRRVGRIYPGQPLNIRFSPRAFLWMGGLICLMDSHQCRPVLSAARHRLS